MKIPIKRYVMDESLTWEERYRQLEAHHEEETTWMAEEIRQLEQPSEEVGVPWDNSRSAYTFDVRLRDGSVVRPSECGRTSASASRSKSRAPGGPRVMQPWRAVVKAAGPHSTTSKISASRTDPRVRRWWRLTLSCGHTIERVCRYRADPQYPRPGRGNSYQRDLDDVAAPPKRVRCERCEEVMS
jgi:hypothetical protein